jgi:tRNA A-37 threonylcarbamoyl transferase component Bud32
MGRVFLAEQTIMGRRVAVKILPKRLGKDPALLKRFLAEARAIAALDHPNIVRAYNVDSEGDRYYLVMEYVEGQDLQRMVEAEGPLPLERAARYVREAADGLAHAHRRALVHCDVKPANLLVSRQDTVKILDMGLARLIDRGKDTEADKDEQLLGSVDYLAPEQAIESPHLDHRADVYSLGCTLYFLLTGRPPFGEGTLHERIVKHQTQKPRKIAELRADVPEELAEICEKMMAKDPEDRFPSADEVSEALSQWQAQQGAGAAFVLESGPAAGPVDVRIEADAPSLARKPRRAANVLAGTKTALAGRGRMLWFAGVGGAVALIVLVGLVFFLVAPGDEGDEAGSQVAARDTLPQDEEPATEDSLPATEQVEDDSDFPDLPDLGDLTDFDPEAVSQADAGKSANSKKEPKPEKPAPVKPRPGPSESKGPSEKTRPTQSESEKPEPHSPRPEEPDDQTEQKSTPAETTSGKKTQSEKPEAETEPQTKKPGATKSKKGKPEKPKPDDPLRDVPESIELSEVGIGASSAEPAEEITIARIHAGPDVPWQLYLLGGQTAMRKNRAFTLKQDGSDASQARWLVQLETAAGSGDPTVEDMARLWRDGDALKLQWVEDAPSSANYLRNCILQIRVEGESKYVTLNQPKSLEPIPIDLERGIASATLPVKWLPDAGTLRVEITKVEGREGHTVEPAGPADPEEPLLLSFPRTDRHGNTADRVAFRLSFTPRATAMQVKVQLLEPPRQAFRPLRGNAPLLRTGLEMQHDQLDKQLHPKNKEPPRGTERSRLNAQVDAVEKQLWYVKFYEEVQGKATIHFRLFTEVDGREVVLAST